MGSDRRPGNLAASLVRATSPSGLFLFVTLSLHLDPWQSRWSSGGHLINAVQAEIWLQHICPFHRHCYHCLLNEKAVKMQLSYKHNHLTSNCNTCNQLCRLISLCSRRSKTFWPELYPRRLKTHVTGGCPRPPLWKMSSLSQASEKWQRNISQCGGC